MRRVGLLVVAVLALAGCGGGDDAPARFAVQRAWSRPTAPGATNGVVYAHFTTDVDDALVGATVTAEVAASATLHASTTDDAGAGAHSHGGVGGGDESEMQTMTLVASFPVARGTTLALAPGGNHVMLEGLARPLATGRPFTIRFVFQSGRTLDATVEVTTNPPS